MTRNRIAATTGLTALATVSLGLALAPAALAAPATLTAPTGPASVQAEQVFDVTGTGCVADDPENPDYQAGVVVITDMTDLADEKALIFLAASSAEGDWTAKVAFPAGTPAGEHQVFAGCDYAYSADPVPYPALTVTVATAVTNTPAPEAPVSTPAPEAAKPSAIRGESANTPGVAAQTTAATTRTAVPGQKIVKVYQGFQPHEWVTVTMHSTPQVLGTFQADKNGVLTVEFTLAEGTEAGMHTLVLEGPSTYFQEGFEVTGAVATASSHSLAYTGASVGLPLALGAGLLVAGGSALVATRRRTGASQA